MCKEREVQLHATSAVMRCHCTSPDTRRSTSERWLALEELQPTHSASQNVARCMVPCRACMIEGPLNSSMRGALCHHIRHALFPCAALLLCTATTHCYY